MIIWILVIICGTAGLVMSFGWYLSAPSYSGPGSDHYDGSSFINPNKVREKGMFSVFKWMIQRDQGPWTKTHEATIGSPPLKSSCDLRITFVNHSTFLIQWKELNILTDPIWSERCSPFTFAGPSRMRPPGINFDDLPPIDMVLISHNHYDHLDVNTLKRLTTKNAPLFIVPLGVKAFLEKNKITNVIELDWWESKEAGLNIKAVPAQHFSGRGLFDRNKTLWSGYIIENEGKKCYFVGDTGYGDFFKKIGKKEGPVDVALIPIGAYLPKWFMSPIHISPSEAVKVHKDIGSRQSIAMHFGTFPLADEGQGKAEEDLILSLQDQKIDQKQFIIPEEGMPMTFDSLLQVPK